MRLRSAPAALVLCGLLAGCGSASPDLFGVERTGSVPGARLTLIVDDGGFVRCNGGERKEMTSEQLIEARDVARELNGESEEKPGPAREHLRLPTRSGSILHYAVTSENGDVAFSDTSAGQPKVFFRVADLTRVLAKGVCGLPR